MTPEKEVLGFEVWGLRLEFGDRGLRLRVYELEGIIDQRFRV